MKEVKVLQRINGVADDLIEEGSTFSVIRKKLWKVYLATAASVLLIVGKRIQKRKYIFNCKNCNI